MARQQYDVTGKLTFDLLDKKMLSLHHFILLDISGNLVIISVRTLDLWSKKVFERSKWPFITKIYVQLILESKWMSVSNVIKFSLGVPGISCSWEWDRQTDGTPENIMVQQRKKWLCCGNFTNKSKVANQISSKGNNCSVSTKVY